MKSTFFNIKNLAGLTLSILFIWIFIFSAWYSNNILDQKRFTENMVSVLKTETVRTSISNEIIDSVRQEAPLVGSITGPILTKIIAGVMDTDLFANFYERSARELHLQLTSANPREIKIQLRPTKLLLTPILDRSNPNLLNAVPNELVIIGKNQIPSLYKFGTYLTISGPILLIIALIILAFVWKINEDKRNYFFALGLIISGSGMLVYLLLPSLGNFISAQVNSINVVNIINEVYSIFTKPLYELSRYFFIFGIIVALVAKFLRRDIFHLPLKSISKSK